MTRQLPWAAEAAHAANTPDVTPSPGSPRNRVQQPVAEEVTPRQRIFGKKRPAMERPRVPVAGFGMGWAMMRQVEAIQRATVSRRVPTAVCGVLLAATVAWTCDTPVFQFTMQNWQRDRYRVYCLFEGLWDTATRLTYGALSDAAGHGGHANLTVTRVDVSNPDSPLPPSIRRVMDHQRARRLPAFAVLSPRGAEIYVGALDSGDAAALIASPKRKEVAQLLSHRKRGVVVLLLGSDAGENRRAGDVIRRVAQSAATRGEDYGVVTVDREDPGEQWLIRQLLSVEPDLAGIRSAMAFPVFGRGHFLPPYVGPGISEPNLRDLQEFLNGPCSCEVKESSQGMDLLLDWDFDQATADWPEAAATAMTPGFTIFDIAPPEEVAGTDPQLPEPDSDGHGPPGPPVRDAGPPRDAPAPKEGLSEHALPAEASSVTPRVVPPSWPEAPTGPESDEDAWETAEEIEVDCGPVLTDSGPRRRHLGPNLAAMRGAVQSSAAAALDRSPMGFALIAAGAMAALALGVAIAGSIMVLRARRLATPGGAGERGGAP